MCRHVPENSQLYKKTCFCLFIDVEGKNQSRRRSMSWKMIPRNTYYYRQPRLQFSHPLKSTVSQIPDSAHFSFWNSWTLFHSSQWESGSVVQLLCKHVLYLYAGYIHTGYTWKQRGCSWCAGNKTGLLNSVTKKAFSTLQMHGKNRTFKPLSYIQVLRTRLSCTSKELEADADETRSVKECLEEKTKNHYPSIYCRGGVPLHSSFVCRSLADRKILTPSELL